MSPRMGWAAVLAAVALLAAACNRSPVLEDQKSNLVGSPAPAVEGELLDGTKFALQQATQDHAVVMLDFWASWCGPCLDELPVLLELADQYRDRDVVLYAVNQGEDASTIRDFLESRGWKFNVVLDPDRKIGRAYGVRGIPQLVLIGRDGTVRHVHHGYSPQIERKLRQQLDVMVMEK